jgi:molybdate transport system substrate-binding protein
MPTINRHPLLKLLFTSFLACFLAVGCRSTTIATPPNSPTQSVALTVSAAASLQDALNAINPEFRKVQPEITVAYNFGSSGALQRQIEQGAPADVFFSAASKQMDGLAQKGLIAPNSRQNLLTNRLVLVAPNNSSLKITDLAQLKDIPINHFAVGEFRSVPAGQYTQQVLEKLELLPALQSKFVFGNNVRSVLAAVASGNADVGMVYASDAALSPQVKVLLTIPQTFHQPIVYPIAIIQRSPHPQAAQRFVDFLTTDTPQTTFAKFGFNRIQ